MFLWQFVHRRWHHSRQPQILGHAITFEQFLDFFHFWHDCWPWPIDYWIRFGAILVVTLALNSHGQIWNLLYLSQKWPRRSPRNEKQTHQLNSRPQMWTSGLTLVMTLTLNFQIWNLIYISTKNGLIAMKRKTNISIDIKASNVNIGFHLSHDLDLEFSWSNMEFDIYINKKWSDCHETKNKHIYWYQGLKCEHWVSPQPWPWPWIFMVKYGICCISTKSDPIVNEKQTYWFNSSPQMWPIGLTLAMTFTFEFSRSNVILTIWWPRSDVRIYQIMTRVTSDVVVPSTLYSFLTLQLFS